MKLASHKRTDTVWFHPYEAPQIVKCIELGNGMVVASGWGQGGKVSYCLTGVEFQFFKMKRVLDLGFTSLWMHVSVLDCTLEIVKMINFILWRFYHN